MLVVRSRRRADFYRLGTAGLLGAIGLAASLMLVMQIEQVRSLLEQRASLDQSYDVGPEGRFGVSARSMFHVRNASAGARAAL